MSQISTNATAGGDPNGEGLPSLPLRSATVSGRKAHHFKFLPDPAARARIAQVLGLIDLPEFGVSGTLSPLGRSDISLSAELSALVVQPCIVTLAPVHSRLKDRIERRYVQDFALPEADEVEIPSDDTEALPEVIDLAAVAIEALALALPLYPRARGAVFAETAFAAPGVEPLKPEDLKPFAGLAGLADKLKKPDDTGD